MKQITGALSITRSPLKSPVHFFGVRSAKTTEIAGTAANPQAYGLEVANLLLPDVLLYRPGTAASFSFAGLNGPTLNDDVFDVMMTIVANTPLTDRVDSPHHLPLKFPYLDSPYHDQKGVLPFLN
ncbi:MAG: hypothetical protein KME35_22610 [Aphanocapsa sp. GSE-SYN-MK-11-07L]|nr:hypothetical protein [Aphanocapsa sp. GSE-SYN-MK-11-07L]